MSDIILSLVNHVHKIMLVWIYSLSTIYVYSYIKIKIIIQVCMYYHVVPYTIGIGYFRWIV